MLAIAQPVIVAALCGALALPLAVYAFAARPDAVRNRALTNLNRGLGPHAPGDRPVDTGAGVGRLAHKLTPAGRVRSLDRMLARAGRPAAWPLERVLVTKLVGTAISVAVSLLLFGTNPSLRSVMFLVVAGVFVWFLPDLLLYNTGMKRRQEVEQTLPDTLDQLTIAVDAGLGFGSALAHVARHSTGALADELVRTLQDIQVGVPRRTAYLALGDRLHVVDLRRFVRALVQAEQHGISIAKVLNAQAKEMRVRRRQRAEETAMKIPVKVVFPLILFILPALFIVILGPAAINIIDAFSNL